MKQWSESFIIFSMFYVSTMVLTFCLEEYLLELREAACFHVFEDWIITGEQGRVEMTQL